MSTKNTKSVSLVLGSGGAQGLAHILKVLPKYNPELNSIHDFCYSPMLTEGYYLSYKYLTKKQEPIE